MSQAAIHFVDPSIPGLSGRDLLLRLAALAQTGCAKAARGATSGRLCGARRELALRKDLADLDRNLLRDIGIDRDAL